MDKFAAALAKLEKTAARQQQQQQRNSQPAISGPPSSNSETLDERVRDFRERPPYRDDDGNGRPAQRPRFEYNQGRVGRDYNNFGRHSAHAHRRDYSSRSPEPDSSFRRDTGDHRHRDRSGDSNNSASPRHRQTPQQYRESQLEQMSQNGFRVLLSDYRPPAWPDVAVDGNAPSPKTFHIALLALTIDDLPYEHLWRAWASAASTACTDESTTVYVSLLCHAKFPDRVRSSWLKQRLLVHPPQAGRGHEFADPSYLTYKPDWGKPSITRAMVALLRNAVRIGDVPKPAAAVPAQTTPKSSPSVVKKVKTESVEERIDKDPRFSTRRFVISNDAPLSARPPPVDRFIYISESCVPVRTLQECVEMMQSNQGIVVQDKKDDDVEAAQAADPPEKEEATATSGQKIVTEISWVNGRHRHMVGIPQNSYEGDQFAGIHVMIPGQFRWKSDQWSMLCRSHAQLIVLVDDRYWPPDNAIAERYPRSDGNQLWSACFGKINASDEMYIASVLGVLGILCVEEHENAKKHLPKPRSDSAGVGTSTEATTQTSQDMACNSAANGANAASDSPDAGIDEEKSAIPPVEEKDSSQDSAEATRGPREGDHNVGPPPLVVSENSACLKRPVTYADWTQGMRNPASFVHGVSDLRVIGARARQLGCLFARKFRRPGNRKLEAGANPESGTISVDEWMQVMEELRSETPASASSLPV
jgi:Core-2/I-Branching enzyme